MNFKECEINGYQCWGCDPYRIVKQNGLRRYIYNTYKAVEPKPGKPVSSYTSVVKEVIRVDKYIDDNGEEKEANVLGPKEYSTLEEAMADCK